MFEYSIDLSSGVCDRCVTKQYSFECILHDVPCFPWYNSSSMLAEFIGQLNVSTGRLFCPSTSRRRGRMRRFVKGFLTYARSRQRVVLGALSCVTRRFVDQHCGSSSPRGCRWGRRNGVRFISTNFVLPPTMSMVFPDPVGHRCFISNVRPIRSS